MDSDNDPFPVDLIAQLVEHCNDWIAIDITFVYIVHLQRVIMNSHNNAFPVGLVAQLVEHCIGCIGIAEVRV